jgi:hypothetical protein
MELAAVLGAVLPLNLLGARLEERVDCPIIPVERGSDPNSAFPDWSWGDFVFEDLAETSVVGSGTRPVGVWSLSSMFKSGDEEPVVGLGFVGCFKESPSAEEPLLCSVLSITLWASQRAKVWRFQNEVGPYYFSGREYFSV